MSEIYNTIPQDPIEATLTFPEQIQKQMENLQLIISWGIITAFILIIIWILYKTKLIELDAIRNLIDLVLGLVILFSPIAIWMGFKTRKNLMIWNNKFLKFSYEIKIELESVVGETSSQRIFNLLIKAFKPLEDILFNYIESDVTRQNNFLNIKIQGKILTHNFDVYIGSRVIKELDKDPTTQQVLTDLNRFCGKFGAFFARRIEKDGGVDVDDIKNLQDEVIDVLNGREIDDKFARIIVISPSDFTDKAIEYARDYKPNKIRGFDLIKEKEKRYSVVFISDF